MIFDESKRSGRHFHSLRRESILELPQKFFARQIIFFSWTASKKKGQKWQNGHLCPVFGVFWGVFGCFRKKTRFFTSDTDFQTDDRFENLKGASEIFPKRSWSAPTSKI